MSCFRSTTHEVRTTISLLILPGQDILFGSIYISPLRLVCYSAVEKRSEPVIAVLFFLLLFLLDWSVEMWITFLMKLTAISVPRPCGRIEQEAEAFRVKGKHNAQARRRDFPCLLFTNVVATKTGHYPGHYSESCKNGQVATKPTRRS